MFPDPEAVLRAGIALLAILLPLWLIARALRGSRAGQKAGRRLAVEEALALDARRRLLLVRCDGREVLLLTGGAQDAVIGWLPPREAP
ncbi:flagellar biosynthetic protein FliO [Paracraurococcus lichenis]|uniref:Flagellar biosynthetic protein FliO n=1 Tax=Paracraurococcus lichenis TaxID=3064888 RepID=A0ABT9DZL4_9PROT|nr:flagellar biosynthetic protein FliO [Paracraurococcus sp. LOR1-02]MDO9709348.1 flagellar biosynthetic protein FliO [Paracraurococcus sp. LOR1-02]